MPIRINLLAEAQALEELRRRDPVKRAIWIGAVIVAGVVAYSAYLQTQTMVSSGEVNRLQAKINRQKSEFKQVVANKAKLEAELEKLGRLQELATNRFLNGTLLDALQHTTVDDVQLVHLKTAHEYIPVEPTKAKAASDGRTISKAKPASVLERISLTLEARDNSGGDQWTKYKSAIAGCSYFLAALGKTNEVKLTTLTPQLGTDGRNFEAFTLECRYPDKSR
jgi:hypothetical protein